VLSGKSKHPVGESGGCTEAGEITGWKKGTDNVVWTCKGRKDKQREGAEKGGNPTGLKTNRHIGKVLKQSRIDSESVLEKKRQKTKK